MNARPFFTRGPHLAFIRSIIEGCAGLDWGRADIASIFRAVDQACSERYPAESRSGWFSPVFLGGVDISHIPPHLVFAVYAIYADLRAGSPAPTAFLSTPLDMEGTTAVQMEPSEAYRVESAVGAVAPMADILFIIPARMSEQWSTEIYGIPPVQDAVTRVSWNAAAAEPTALATGQLLLHRESGQVLNPMAPAFSPEEEGLFFGEPVLPSRLERYRERLVELSGTPQDVLARNHDHARRVLEAYLELDGRAVRT